MMTTTKEWISWGTSVIGPAHLRLGAPNQDAWMVRNFIWGNVVVVSDGLGSRQKSEIGSRAVCNAVIKAAKIFHNFHDSSVENLFELTHSIWKMIIAPNEPYDCAATCLFAIRCEDRIILAQLGDGLIAACDSGDKSMLLEESKEDSFSNMTHCLGPNHYPEFWRFSIINPDQYDAVILCTDGISDDLLPEKSAAFARELFLSYKEYENWKRTRELKKWLLNWPVPGHSDDKTIACLFRKGT